MSSSWPSGGFRSAKSFDQAIYDEQILLERWRSATLADNRLRTQWLSDGEWGAMQHSIVPDGLEGPHTALIRNLKQRIP